jgi:predicted metalloprotease with PDZ domain
MSDELWFAEGFTQYYGALLMKRAGLATEEDYLQTLTHLVNTKLNAPGATLYTPIQASNMAVFTDAGVSVDKTNYPNIFTSYYTYGAAIALALDLELRSRFNKSLDVYMQQVWLNHGRKEIPYTIPDLRKALEQVSDVQFAKAFFEKYIYGHQPPDYQTLLASAGIAVQQKAAGEPWIGNAGYTDHPAGTQIAGSTLRTWPLYEAGLDAQDVIFNADDKEIRSGADFIKVLVTKRPGDKLNVDYIHRGIRMKTVIIVKENPAISVAPMEMHGKNITTEQLNFRTKWLGAQ